MRALIPTSALGGLTVIYPVTLASSCCVFSLVCCSVTWMVLVRAPSLLSSTVSTAGPAPVRRRKASWIEMGVAGSVL